MGSKKNDDKAQIRESLKRNYTEDFFLSFVSRNQADPAARSTAKSCTIFVADPF
jgi:hypothetical protein